MKDKRPIHKIQHGRVHYLYVIGISWIQIDTDPKTDWPEMPEYMRVCFAIETPDEDRLSHALEYNYALENFILDAIKKKTNEQRKAHGATPKRNKSLGVSADKSGKPEKALPDSKRTKRKPATPVLPFESDDDSALRTGIA